MLRFNQEQRAKIAEVDGFRREIRKADKKARPKSEKATRGRQIDNGFRQYVRRQPCEARHLGGCMGPVHHAHVSYRVDGIPNSFGRGVKNHDRHGNPLCLGHHEQQHAMGDERRFWAMLGKDAYETAAAHFAKYQAGDQ
ncbi:hypothetical protein [Brevundimonas sp. Root1423]|uniref:hypothetical protein n=1 Tax=Brevundimonas sp. Root1423 TaxID=1736462 RepID=UPI0006F40E26|nr:hypothetical protein [Brevundimonas sp. Root1423]KQY96409.1 hypothetical protein ASD25_00525 [Brevundimonas sp. Root1423]